MRADHPVPIALAQARGGRSHAGRVGLVDLGDLIDQVEFEEKVAEALAAMEVQERPRLTPPQAFQERDPEQQVPDERRLENEDPPCMERFRL